jgi:hypothetical protein
MQLPRAVIHLPVPGRQQICVRGLGRDAVNVMVSITQRTSSSSAGNPRWR